MKLENNISFRKEYKEKIRKAVNLYCCEKYGIENFFQIVEKFIPQVQENRISICLARQIPTVNLEHLIHYLISEWIKTSFNVETFPVSFSFARDTFMSKNNYKKSLINLPYLRRGRKGKYVHIEKIANGTTRDGTILDSIETIKSLNLLEYHQELRKEVFGFEIESIDLLGFFKTCLNEAISNNKNPRHVYRRIGSTEKRSIWINPNDDIRPSAEWYYFFYLALFMDGDKILLESIHNDDAQVKRWFYESEKALEEITGLKPLIIHMPNQIETDNYKSECLEYLDFTFESGWKEKLNFPSKKISVFEAMKFLGEEIMGIV